MTSLQGISDYDIKQKNDWRGWAWNRLTERLSVPVEDARVLYLCGPDDKDREEGIKRGYSNHNLIAVDSSEANIARVRSAGGYGVSCDFNNAISSWPEDYPVHGVVADFCSGLTALSSAFLMAMCVSRGFRFLEESNEVSCSVVVNFQRGRDSFSNQMRREMSQFEKTHDMVLNRMDSSIGGASDASKHRAGLFYAFLLLTYFDSLIDIDDAPFLYDESELLKAPVFCKLSLNERRWHFSEFCEATEPRFYSYKASRVFMDSAAFRYRFFYPAFVGRGICVDRAVRRKIAALRAVQTMRGVA